MNRNNWNEKLQEVCQSIGVVDTHDHIWGKSQRRLRNPDLFDYIEESYLYFDLLSAGMPPKILDKKYSKEQRWKSLYPYLCRVSNTAYYRLLISAFQELYDFTDIEINEHN